MPRPQCRTVDLLLGPATLQHTEVSNGTLAWHADSEIVHEPPESRLLPVHGFSTF